MKQINPRVLVKTLNEVFNESAGFPAGFVSAVEENGGLKLKIGNQVAWIQPFGVKTTQTTSFETKYTVTERDINDEEPVAKSIGLLHIHKMLLNHEDKHRAGAFDTQDTAQELPGYSGNLDHDDDIDDF